MFPTLLFSQLNNEHKSKARKVNQFFIRKELILDKGQGFWKRCEKLMFISCRFLDTEKVGPFLIKKGPTSLEKEMLPIMVTYRMLCLRICILICRILTRYNWLCRSDR